jgi:hypothetical protein
VLDASIEEAVKAAEQSANSLDSGIGDLFGGLIPEEGVDVYSRINLVPSAGFQINDTLTHKVPKLFLILINGVAGQVQSQRLFFTA